MTKPFRPLRSAKAPGDLSTLKFPVFVSPKIDGIRCVVKDGVAYTRKLTEVPNRFIQSILGCADFDGLDGELVVGADNAADAWNSTQSGWSSHDGEPNFVFHVFDDFTDPGFDFETRLHATEARVLGLNHPRLQMVHHELAYSAEEIEALQEKWIGRGYEGVMLRSPDGVYKFGDSTLKEGILLKLKKWDDSEALVVGFVEEMENTAEAVTDARGYAKKTKRKGDMVGKNSLGAFIVHWKDKEFEIGGGPGLTKELRAYIWNNRAEYKGGQVKFKYQGLTPAGIPRFPGYLGMRDARD